MRLVVTGESNIFYLAYLTWKNIIYPHSKLFNKNTLCTQNLGEARFNDLRRDLLCLRLLKSSSKRIHLPKKHQFYSTSHFSFFRPSFPEVWSNMNLFFSQWKLQLFKFSTLNKKSGTSDISSYFTLTRNEQLSLLAIQSQFINLWFISKSLIHFT